jgi:hypothetical protein
MTSINNSSHNMDLTFSTDIKDFDLADIDVSALCLFSEDTIVPDIHKTKNNTDYDLNYDNLTHTRYKVMRKMKTCPVCDDPVDTNPFVVPNMWDSITGEFIEQKDPYGPLYFHPVCLIECFYHNRMNCLLSSELDEGAAGGYYEAVPGDGLGAGEDMETSRGDYPELFLWRLPINDCYLEVGLSRSIPLKGPKLVRSDIVELKNIVKKLSKKDWADRFVVVPDILLMYDIYMEAISKNPNTSKITGAEGKDKKFLANLAAAKKLLTM